MKSVMPKSPYIVDDRGALKNFRKSGLSMGNKRQKDLMLSAHASLTRKAKRKKKR